MGLNLVSMLIGAWLHSAFAKKSTDEFRANFSQPRNILVKCGNITYHYIEEQDD